MFRFTAKISKLGINPVIDPPADALTAVFAQAGRSSGPIPVRGRLDEAQFIQTLVKYKGKWRLYINGEMMQTSGARVGGLATVELEFDPEPRVVPVPPKFRAILESDDRLAAAFAVLSPGRQREILRYLGSLKTEAALDRNIERVTMQLQTLSRRKQ